mmetsp:Transcript_1229/g.3706  ORF Transcript_1229/g.3706 Transcript_1229/m.3706 type:complete len:272 (-) Transcript_1229:89-904(-)
MGMSTEAFVVEKPIASFIRTLFALVNGPYAETLIAWTTDGGRVIVEDPEAFARQVCPRHFRHSKWTSFSRLLNMYNFRKVSAATDGTAVVWEHDDFRRDGQADLWKVVRKSKMPREPSSPRTRSARVTRSATREKLGVAEPLPEAPSEEDGAELWMRRAAALERQVAALQLENAQLRALAAGGDDGDGVEDEEPESPRPPAALRQTRSAFEFSADDFADLALADDDPVFEGLSEALTWSPAVCPHSGDSVCAACGSPKNAFEQSKRRKRED